MKTLIKTDILRFGFAFLLLGFCAGGAIWPAPTLAAIALDPTQTPGSQGFVQDGIGPAMVSGGNLLVGDGTNANRNLWLRDEPSLATRKVKVRVTVSAAATALEALGITGVGLILDANTGRAAQVVLADVAGTKKVALLTQTGRTNGVVANWGSPVTFELSWDPAGDVTLAVVGGGQETVPLAALQSSLGLRTGPYWGFGCASGTAVVTATFGAIEEVAAPTTKPLDIVAEKLEIKTFGVSEVEHEVEGRDEDDADRKSGIKFEGVIHATDGSPLDPTVMPVTVAISGLNGEIYNSGAIASGFVFNGNEYKYKASSLKMEMEQQNATSFAYKMELKRRNTDLPAGDYSNLTVTVTVGDYQGSVSVPLSLNGHKWKN